MDNENKEKWLIPLGGAFNMRDLGGFKNAFGKTVKYKKLFRSDDLSALTSEDLDYLTRLPLHTVIDFRSSSEIKAAINHLPQTVSKYIKLPINAGNLAEINIMNLESPEQLMKIVYGDIIRDSQEQYTKFFELLLDKHNNPLLFHCTAGKDRTGIAAALLLSALAVDREDIYTDYMRSVDCLLKKYGTMVNRYPELEAILTVKREYLEAAFQVIDEEFDGVENYLVNCLNVEVAILRELYTE